MSEEPAAGAWESADDAEPTVWPASGDDLRASSGVTGIMLFSGGGQATGDGSSASAGPP
jgi:hypothetical protein